MQCATSELSKRRLGHSVLHLSLSLLSLFGPSLSTVCFVMLSASQGCWEFVLSFGAPKKHTKLPQEDCWATVCKYVHFTSKIGQIGRCARQAPSRLDQVLSSRGTVHTPHELASLNEAPVESCYLRDISGEGSSRARSVLELDATQPSFLRIALLVRSIPIVKH